MSEREVFEVHAVRYAALTRGAAENFIDPGPHNGPMDMDFYVWAAIGPRHTYIIDTGYGEAAAKRRGRTFLQHPVDGLRAIGIDAGAMTEVIVTHLHYDHIGNYDAFPNARYHLHDKEMMFATGRYMTHEAFRRAYEVDEVVGMVRAVFDGRVVFYDRDTTLTPGLSVHHIGGHTMGLQAVRVWTRRGWVVLASDATHFYANMDETRPFPIVYHVGEMIDGYRKLHALADSPGHIIPGHDPLVLKRYPPARSELEGFAARLDLDPA